MSGCARGVFYVHLHVKVAGLCVVCVCFGARWGVNCVCVLYVCALGQGWGVVVYTQCGVILYKLAQSSDTPRSSSPSFKESNQQFAVIVACIIFAVKLYFHHTNTLACLVQLIG